MHLYPTETWIEEITDHSNPMAFPGYGSRLSCIILHRCIWLVLSFTDYGFGIWYLVVDQGGLVFGILGWAGLKKNVCESFY